MTCSCLNGLNIKIEISGLMLLNNIQLLLTNKLIGSTLSEVGKLFGLIKEARNGEKQKIKWTVFEDQLCPQLFKEHSLEIINQSIIMF